jgi:xanthine dehydrogenase accessory factor
VTITKGSTPQKSGSSALFSEKGLISGTVGGGIVEGKIQQIAIEAAQSKTSGYFHFNLANEFSTTKGAICGGKISILVDANLNHYKPLFEQMQQSIENGISGVLITIVTGLELEKILINRYWMSETSNPTMSNYFLEQIKPIVLNMLSVGNQFDYRALELPNTDKKTITKIFIEPIYPRNQLVVVGAGHISKALTSIGRMLHFEVTVIDDRPEYANFENIPDANHIIVNNIGEAIHALKKNEHTYIVIVSRGHNDDAEAVKSCIGSNLAYIGMIGSKIKIAKMRKSFMENGWVTAAQWDKIHAPIGIDIKAQTVEEIAISIAAELVQVRNSKKFEVPIKTKKKSRNLFG